MGKNYITYGKGLNMNNEQMKSKAPISEEKIYRIMFYVTFGVSGIFLIKNILLNISIS